MSVAAKQLYTDGEVFTRKVTVRGSSAFDGDGEFNASYGIHVDVTLKAPLGRGARTEVRPCIDKAVVDRIANVQFPFEAEVSFIELASKKATQLTVVNVKPISAAVGKGA